MAESFVQYTASGSTDTFNIPFGYLDPDHITVTLDGVVTTFTFPSESQVQISSGNPSNGVIVEIRRNTPRDAREIVWQNASNLTASDLNVSDLQLFYITQESFDVSASNLVLEGDGNFTAGSRRIKDVSDPVNPQDAATKAYADSTLNATAQDVIDAEAAKTAAELAQSLAETAEGNAAGILTQVQLLYDNFDDTYLGAFAADPTVDNDGDPLQDGALYYNTTSNNMRFYDGSTWVELDTVIGDDTITNEKLSNVSQNTIKGRISSGVGDPEDLTAAQVRTLLSIYTQAEVDALLAALPSPLISESYTSSEITISSGGTTTLTHGLSSAPKAIQLILKCITADLNYAVDDEVVIGAQDTMNSTSSGVSLTQSSSEIYVRFGSANPVFHLLDKTTGARTGTTNARWKLIVKAYA